MTEKEVLKDFFELEGADEQIVEAWEFFIETQRAYRDEQSQSISRQERDTIRRKFERYMRKNKLVMMDEKDGLKAHEVAIAAASEAQKAAEGGIRTLNSFDIWLLTDFEDICATWLAEDFGKEEGVQERLIAFLDDPYVNINLKERLIEKEKARGEKLLKTILEENPSKLGVHLLLVGYYEREDRLADAEAEYKRFLENTDDELAWANYGSFLERQERYEEAFDAFKESLEVCERMGEAGERLGTIVKDHISRVERLKDLEGEEAEKAREYHEAIRLLADIKDFAEERLSEEIAKAKAEFKEEREVEAIDIEEVFDFLSWFLYARKLEDGSTPGILYAEEVGLSADLRKKIEGLGSPVKSTFEVVIVDSAAFKYVVKDTVPEEGGAEYELRGDLPDIREGMSFTANIYPWGDFYITVGPLNLQGAGEADKAEDGQEEPLEGSI